MWKPTNIFISTLLIVDTFVVSYAVGLNSRHVLVVDPSLGPSIPVSATPVSSTTTKATPAPAKIHTSSSTATSASISTSTPARFTDLSQTQTRLQSSLTQAADAGILDPTTDKKFRPNDPVTRADFTRWMVRVRQTPTESPATATYSDVPAANPYYKEIEGANKAMMVQGYTVKGTAQKEFKPDQFITRQELAVMYGTFSGKRGRAEKLTKDDIERYLRYNPVASTYGTLTYRDVGDVDDWARKWIAVAQQSGVLGQCFDVNPYDSADDKKYLHPQQKMTRAEAVNILVKLYGIQSKNAVSESH